MIQSTINTRAGGGTNPRVIPMFVAAMVLVAGSGCSVLNKPTLVSNASQAVPAHRLPPGLFDCPREPLAPINYATLGQTKPAEHRIGPGDTLSVYIFGVFPPGEDETPIIQRSQAVNQRYYPARGSSLGPTTGLPVRVEGNGTVDLPLIGSVDLNGLSISQAKERIAQLYRDEEILKEGNERISVTLQQPRVYRVTVLREDTPSEAVTLTSPQNVDQIHRGSGQVLDLPAYENDVLHAMTFTGGLPGTDAAREVYVIRKGAGMPQFMSAGNLQSIVSGGRADLCSPDVVRIPLAGCPCDTIPFTERDITLDEGDVLFIPRRNEYFIAAGLLPGGRVPLPRDEDIDVIEAIAMATGSFGGPLGTNASALAAGNVGNLRSATKVLILRMLPDGRQMTIRVDLDRATYDPKQRIRILPGDVVSLHHKPTAAVFYGVINYVNSVALFRAFEDR